MPIKNILFPHLVITNGSMAGNLTSSSIDMAGLDNVGFAFTSTGGGSPTGTISVQGSNDNINWFTVPTIPASPAFSGADATVGVSINLPIDFPFRFVRTQYTFTSGTGSLNVLAHAKSLG